VSAGGAFRPKDPDYARRVRDSFARQGFMGHLGVRIGEIGPGTCELVLPVRPELTQHHGHVHAGAVTTLADTAGGYAAATLLPAGFTVVTAEFKANFLAPARGELVVARGRVVRPGRTLTVCQVDVVAVADGEETHVALMQQTIFALPGDA
jgi:uncharacterized protein (TIGR00369 family)